MTAPINTPCFKKTLPEVDAFTGGPLVGIISQCAKCQCHYSAESVQALVEHNNGACMACGSTELTPKTDTAS